MVLNTQQKLVVDYIRCNGYITSFTAATDLGIIALPARIYELKKLGCPITTVSEKSINKYNKPVRYNKYYIDGDDNE